MAASDTPLDWWLIKPLGGFLKAVEWHYYKSRTARTVLSDALQD